MRLIQVSIILVTFLAMQASAQTTDPSASEMRFPLEKIQADLRVLRSKYTVPLSDVYQKRMEAFYHEWLNGLEKEPFDSMSHAGQVDYVLFKNNLRH